MLEYTAATQYYDHQASQMHAQGGVYGQPHHSAGHSGYYQPQQPHGYGPVYYPISQQPASQHGFDMGHHAAYDQKKRGYDALNDFFGDAKRRQIDPTSYSQVGQRLMLLHGLPIQGGALVDYMPSQQMMGVGGGHGPEYASMPQSQYSLPMPNLKTKSDLLNIDNFLDQMQSTVYESSSAAAAAGIHQPGSHYTHPAMDFRQSHSPPQAANHNVAIDLGQQAPNTTNPAHMMGSIHSPESSTSVLTPPSGSLSYTAGQSPNSVPGLSPSDSSRQPSNASAGYPTLPAVSSVYAPHSNESPVSTLGTNFDNDPRRRFSGAMLQKSAGPRAAESPVDSSGSATPEAKKPVREDSQENSQDKETIIDPALSGVNSPSTNSESEAAKDRAEEVWVENVRAIEALRKLIVDRLERHDYEDDGDVEMSQPNSRRSSISKKEDQNLYPVLRAAIDAAE